MKAGINPAALEEAPRRIRQSRSCRGREQSFAHSGVLDALLQPVGDGCSASCGAELFWLFLGFSLRGRNEDLPCGRPGCASRRFDAC
jgi:hypothetical protein